MQLFSAVAWFGVAAVVAGGAIVIMPKRLIAVAVGLPAWRVMPMLVEERMGMMLNAARMSTRVCRRFPSHQYDACEHDA